MWGELVRGLACGYMFSGYNFPLYLLPSFETEFPCNLGRRGCMWLVYFSLLFHSGYSFGPPFYDGSNIGHFNLGGPWALSFVSRGQKSVLSSLDSVKALLVKAVFSACLLDLLYSWLSDRCRKDVLII